MNKILNITKDKRHIIIDFMGIKLSLKHFVDKKMYRKFVDKKVAEKTILIIEPNGCHFETITGLCKYCSELGYNVDVLTREPAEKIFENFKIKTTLRSYECNPVTFDKIYKKYDFSQYERIIYNSKRIYFISNGFSLDGYDLAEYYNSVKKGKKENIYLQHHIDKFNDSPTDIQIVLANPAKLPELDNLIVNCNYFKDFETKIKNKNDVTNFISIGELSKQRRNSTLLIDAVKSLHNNGIENFKITVIGIGELDELPVDIRRYFNILGRVDYQTMFDELEKSDFVLPLLDPEIEAHKRYMDSGTSGTFQLVYGFNKPCIIHKTFADIYGFNEKNSIIYEYNDKLQEAMQNAINMSNEEYKILKAELSYLENSIDEISFKNMERLLSE